MKINPGVFALAMGLVLPGLVSAQSHDHGPPTQTAIGSVHFPVSCSAPAQRQFDRAVALLHSFWYEEAETAFRAVLTEDRECAMARWGLAISRLHLLWQPPAVADITFARSVLDSAIVKRATPREIGYLNAARAYFGDDAKRSHGERMRAFESAMEKLHIAEPNDTEAQIFYALAVRANADPRDRSLSRQRRAGEMLEPLFRAQPDHPGLAHYLIHIYDYPALAERGLEAARRYSRIAPAVPHARHMPSHIFTLLGLWTESARSNRSAAAAGSEFEKKRGTGAAWDQRLHALDYLVYALLQTASYDEARGIVEEVDRIKLVEPAASLAAEYALAAIPARFALERDDWNGAMSLRVRPATFPAAEAVTRFARAIGAARSGHIAQAAAEIEELKRLELKLRDDPWATVVAAQHTAASAWVRKLEGRPGEAISLAQQAAEMEESIDKHPVTPASVLPARELLADLLLESGLAERSQAEYIATLKREPGRRRSTARISASAASTAGSLRPE